MKNNGNDKKTGDYYLGLDVGTNSCGWAVTDQDYNVLKFHGQSMWGARLFEEANDASERRTAREARRRLARRKYRIYLLEQLFAEEIHKTDPNFFIRLRDSNLYPEDKEDAFCRYALFNDPNYTDKDYLKQYPTIYHLRSELIHSKDPHDVRLVFLALHHIIKSRGHFLYEDSKNEKGISLDDALDEFKEYLNGEGIDYAPEDKDAFNEALLSDARLNDKKKALKAAYGNITESEDLDISVLNDLLAGATVQLYKLFKDDSLKDADTKSVCIKDDIDAKLNDLSAVLDDRVQVITLARQVYDVSRLDQVLGNNAYISDAKVALYNKNQKDTKILKKYIRKHFPKDYKKVFNDDGKSHNFAAYVRYKVKNRCTQKDFCSFLKDYVKGMKDSEDPEERRIYQEIEENTFLTKLKGSDNGLIPFQQHLKELDAILDNASEYLPFLNEADKDGKTVKEKIRSIFTFKIPYYVGPLSKKANHNWIVRSDEKIYPWNFNEIVDLEASAHGFMDNLVGRCTYTGDEVLPYNSLLYSEYMVLNEINPLKVNGRPISVEVKKQIFSDLFVNSKKKVTKKSIKKYLLANGLIEQGDEISGVDDEIKANLKSWHDFERILKKIDKEQVEKIIKSVVVFGDNQKMLRKWIRNNVKDLSNDDINYVCRLRYKDWGRLSKTFLTGIYHVNEDGEAFSIMDLLRDTNQNMMQLMSNEYQFADKAEQYRKEKYGLSDSLKDRLDNLYIAPSVRRSIWQTMRVVDEIVDIRKSAPKKIFIEMARDDASKIQKERTTSRKKQLLALYESCKEQEHDLYDQLLNETDQTLRRDRLYLYYTQFGKCMYSEERIDLNKLMDNQTYDIDHIFPRSRIKDNSLDNKVLVKSSLNREKTNAYPISENIRTKMKPFWSTLHDKKLISDKKYERLTRNYPLTDEELSSFVARQLVETRQSTKALATILQERYEDTKIVYSKAGNVSDFRQEFDLPKFRDVNDLHHAKDAYLNIVVGNVYDTRFTSRFFANIHNENYSLNKVFDFDTKNAWKADGSSIGLVKKYMKKNNPIVTFAPYETKGAISNLQIMPKGKGQLAIKKNMDPRKYGGYNKVSGAYYALVEHTEKKKIIRTLIPIYIYNKAEFEKDPVSYCESIGYHDSKVIVRKILNGALLEVNGLRLMVTGRTGSNNVYKHGYEFAIDDEHAQELKDIHKYVDRCAVAKKTLPVNEYDHVSSENNIDLYDWFIGRLKKGAYAKLFSKMASDMEENRKVFVSKDLLTQSKLLLEILKAFKCDRQITNFEELNKKKNVGIIQFSSNLSNMKSAYLINQSVTGLYEKKINLLK